MKNTEKIMLYIVFVFIIISVFILIEGVIGLFNFSQFMTNLSFYLMGFLVLIIINKLIGWVSEEEDGK